jgi:hypothetical protein
MRNEPGRRQLSRSAESSMADVSDRCAEALTGLPALLDMASAILLVACRPGREDADDLRRRIEECVVDAHRLLLSLRIESLQGGDHHGRESVS